MAQIKFTINKDDALDIVKESIAGKVAILKNNGYELKVGSPMMTATIIVGDGVIDINGSAAGKIIASTCESAIELGIKKAEKEAKGTVTVSAPNKQVVSQKSDLDTQLKAASLLKVVYELKQYGVLTEEDFENKKRELISKLEIKSFEEVKLSGKCPYCGDDITEEMDFCGNCGKKLK